MARAAGSPNICAASAVCHAHGELQIANCKLQPLIYNRQSALCNLEEYMAPYTPILATLGYVMSPDGMSVLLSNGNRGGIDRNLGRYKGRGASWTVVRM